MAPDIIIHPIARLFLGIGDIIRDKRQDLPLIQSELADLWQETQSMIFKLEKGAAKNVSVDNFENW